jgi:hypothetical protein
MLKKIVLFLMVMAIAASLLSACRGSSAAADVNAKKLLADLNAKARLLYNQPGWVHVTQKITYDTDKQDRGTLPDGKAIPLVQVIDIWYHINENKLTYEFVWGMYSQDGQLVDLNVFRNYTVYDLTYNVSNPQNPYSLNLDYQFADEMDNFISKGGNHPVITTVMLNGKSATVFTLDEKLASPRTTEDYSQPITSSGSIVYFDTESGLLLKMERSVTLADGSKRTFYTDNMTIVTGVQPPLDIQNYANGIW